MNTLLLQENIVDLTRLSPIQRVILATDGTLTKVLEAYLSEHIELVKLDEQLIVTDEAVPFLEIEAGREVIERKILLRGENSQENLLYARSLIVPDRLTEQHRHDLLESGQTIGRIWLEHRIETFKEMVETKRESAGDLAQYFGISVEDTILYRTYRVYTKRKPVMLITEKLPEVLFV